MNSWIYELIDGDRATDGRSTGDVGFHLQAAGVGKKVYVFYDSILVVNQNSEATQGEVRLATRSTIYPEDWVYQTVAITGGPVAVSGYNVGISVVGNRVFGSWYSASGITIPNPNKINWAVISNSDPVIAASSDAYGTPIGALAIDDKDLIFELKFSNEILGYLYFIALRMLIIVTEAELGALMDLREKRPRR